MAGLLNSTTMTAYNPTWRDKLAAMMMGDGQASPERRAFVGGLMGSTGLGSNGVGVVDATPIGGLLAAQDAAQHGDYKGAALAALPMPAGKAKGIIAYHGSPHSFDRFDLSKIGTGEGAQAYGHGLYFADSEGVAKSYRDKLGMGNVEINGRPAADIASESYNLPYGQQPTVEHKIADIIASYGDNARPVMEARYPELLKAYDKLKAAGTIKEPGSMYQVRINADPEHFLDWDKPLSEQSPVVQEALRKRYGFAFDKMVSQNFAGDDIAHRVENIEHVKEMSQAGLPGIKYLDQGSRGAGDGSRNYVVFDDKLIDILRKYGIAGMLGGGAAMGAASQGQNGGPQL